MRNVNYSSEEKTVAVLYKIGLFVFVPLVILFFFLRTDMALNHLIQGGYFCSFKRLTGLNCPGCGGTRASIYLARFKIIASFKSNATVPVSVALYLYFMLRQTAYRVIGTKSLKEKDINILLVIFVVTVIVRWIICNFVFIL